ncbi:MAG TPA: hypothetical protein VKP59_04070 [Candidatus Thermoplasmatota archaeon]|nr:hypothetical protein [Candidatus Thermoplasmatota archaeon]
MKKHAFDHGLITVNTDHTVQVSKKDRLYMKEKNLQSTIVLECPKNDGFD